MRKVKRKELNQIINVTKSIKMRIYYFILAGLIFASIGCAVSKKTNLNDSKRYVADGVDLVLTDEGTFTYTNNFGLNVCSISGKYVKDGRILTLTSIMDSTDERRMVITNCVCSSAVEVQLFYCDTTEMGLAVVYKSGASETKWLADQFGVIHVDTTELPIDLVVCHLNIRDTINIPKIPCVDIKYYLPRDNHCAYFLKAKLKSRRNKLIGTVQLVHSDTTIFQQVRMVGGASK